MKKKFNLVVFFTFMLPLTVMAANSLNKRASIFSLQQCIDIALKEHSSLKASAGAIKVSESKVGQAKANYYPQINWSTSYQRVSPASTLITSSTDTYNEYSTNVSLGITLIDFGKTATKVIIKNLTVNASQADFDDVSTQVVLNVKNAYYNLLQAKRNQEVAVDTMRLFKQHLDQAKVFFRIGTKPIIDVTKAEVDLGNARLNVLKGENTQRVAMIVLKDAMGIPENADFVIVDNLSFKKSDMQLNDVLNTAYANRPVLRSAIAKTKAAERSVDLARKDYYPVLSGNAGYGYSGTDYPLGNAWNAGATLNFPLFSGLSSRYQADEARANLQVVKANEDILRQETRLDVQQSYLNVKDAFEQISVAEMTVLKARENYDLASSRYRAGMGSPIEITDATISLNNARAALNSALYNYKTAQAAMEKALGAKS